MASDSDDFDQWLEQHQREFEAERREQEEVERLQKEHLIRQHEGTDRFLRAIGYPTRTLVYLIALLLVWVLPYLFFDTKNLADRPIGSLTFGEISNNLLPLLICGGGTLMLIKGFFAEADGGLDQVSWEGWGKVGLYLAGIGAVITYVLIGQRP